MTAAPERFSPATRALLDDGDTDFGFSAASGWEMAIKHSLGKLRLPAPPPEYIEGRLQRTRTFILPISLAHGLRAGSLPRHHADPFDRLLIAQAQLEGMRVLTSDPRFKRYDVEVIEA